MSAKHTSGPWRVSCDRIVSVKTNVVLAETCSPSAYDPEHREQDANRRLIAAAPELLEALKAMVQHGGESAEEWIDLRYLQQAQAAIRKAEGV